MYHNSNQVLTAAQMRDAEGALIAAAEFTTGERTAEGFYRVTGVGATEFGVKAYDPATQARGYATAKLSKAGGYAKDVNLVLIAAAAGVQVGGDHVHLGGGDRAELGGPQVGAGVAAVIEAVALGGVAHALQLALDPGQGAGAG